MAKIFVSDIQPNQEVAAPFAVAERQLRTARNGAPYLHVRLGDRTGEITGRAWERAEEFHALLPARGVVLVRGRAERYQDDIQLRVLGVEPLSPGAFDPADFLPACPTPAPILLDRLKKTLALQKRPFHRQLMKRVLSDAALMERFSLAPAAKGMHHAYIGGLLEHTASVAGLVARVCEHYPELDRDLLLSGAVLHDIGKIHEYTWDVAIDYSDEGRLVGHMAFGIEILDAKLKGMKDAPPEEAMLLKHMILSHHGVAEYGAVKLPMTREALVLHLCDDLDAKVAWIGRLMADLPADENWSAFQHLFGRPFYRARAPEAAPEGEVGEERGVQLSFFAPGRVSDA